MKKYFITFATSNWKKARQRMDNDIDTIQKQYNLFDKYIFFDETILDKDYLDVFSEHFTDRGFAYWSWKPYIIKKTLEQLNTGDILFYMDGGCSFPINNLQNWINDFDSYIIGLQHYDIGLTISSSTTQAIAKKKILNFFNLYNDIFFKKYFAHYQAGIQIMYKSDKIYELICKWYDFFKKYYIDLIKSDFYDKTNEDECFYHNGADQAVLHCLLYKNNINVMNIGKLIQSYHMITRIRG